MQSSPLMDLMALLEKESTVLDPSIGSSLQNTAPTQSQMASVAERIASATSGLAGWGGFFEVFLNPQILISLGAFLAFGLILNATLSRNYIRLTYSILDGRNEEEIRQAHFTGDVRFYRCTQVVCYCAFFFGASYQFLFPGVEQLSLPAILGGAVMLLISVSEGVIKHRQAQNNQKRFSINDCSVFWVNLSICFGVVCHAGYKSQVFMFENMVFAFTLLASFAAIAVFYATDRDKSSVQSRKSGPIPLGVVLDGSNGKADSDHRRTANR
jgi:hypothetical protein